MGKAVVAAVDTFVKEVKNKGVVGALGSALEAGGKHLKVEVTGTVKSKSKSISNKPKKFSSSRRRSISYSSRRISSSSGGGGGGGGWWRRQCCYSAETMRLRG